MRRLYKHLDDRGLVLALKNTDRLAFNEIYERYWAKLYNSVYKRVNDSDTTLDIVQEVFCSLWARRENLNIENLSGYLYQSVKFQTLKFFRKHNLESKLKTELSIVEFSSSSDTQVLEREVLQKFNRLVLKLSPKQREIFRMRFEEYKTPEQIAELQKLSAKTVQNYLSIITIEIKQKLILLSLIGFEPFQFVL